MSGFLGNHYKKAGFTGTSKLHMSTSQKVVLRDLLDAYAELHHGDCIKSDADAHDIAVGLGLRIVAHPCTIEHMRAWKKAHVILTPKEPLERNKDIVYAVDELFATPMTKYEVLRSGTWATIRYARILHKPVMIIHRDGSVERS